MTRQNPNIYPPNRNQESNKPPSWRKRVGSLIGRTTISSLFSNHERTSTTDLFETQGYVKSAPQLHEQLSDASRTNIITSSDRYLAGFMRDINPPANQESLPEHEALRRLDEFLATVEETDAINETDRIIARDMRENLTFIGEKEMNEASAGIALYWIKQLRENNQLQLLIQTINHGHATSNDGYSSKSGEHVLRKIFDNFSEEEIELYGSRITFNSYDTSSDLATKAVLLDDWSISGTQLRQLRSNLSYEKGIDSFEVNLIVAAPDLIANGLRRDNNETIPVKSYYQSNPTETQSKPSFGSWGDVYPGYVAGAHSSVDFNFDYWLATITQQASEVSNLGEPIPELLKSLPPIAAVARPYYVTHDEHTWSPKIDRINELNGHTYHH